MVSFVSSASPRNRRRHCGPACGGTRCSLQEVRPRSVPGASWLTAAIPMDNPYCSCKLTLPRCVIDPGGSAHQCQAAAPIALCRGPPPGRLSWLAPSSSMPMLLRFSQNPPRHAAALLDERHHPPPSGGLPRPPTPACGGVLAHTVARCSGLTGALLVVKGAGFRAGPARC